MIAYVFRSAAILLLAAGLTSCGDPPNAKPNAKVSAPAKIAAHTPAVQLSTPPPDFIYARWSVVEVQSDDGSVINVKDPAWVGATLEITKQRITIDPPPKDMHRLSYAGRDIPNTCTAPGYNSNLKQSASDMTVYRDVYRRFGLAAPAQGHAYLISCNPDIPTEDEVSREEIDGPFLLYIYAPQKIIMVWGCGRILLLQKQ